ncbi:MAG: hypothetical protein AAGK57_00100 [Pseudomonadota bacterium]
MKYDPDSFDAALSVVTPFFQSVRTPDILPSPAPYGSRLTGRLRLSATNTQT